MFFQPTSASNTFLFSSVPTRTSLWAALTLSLGLIQGCGGGGGGNDATPEPVKPSSYDLQATMSQYYTKAQSWSLSGTVGAVPVSAVLSVVPKTGTAVFPVNGKAYTYTQQEMKLTANGQTTNTMGELFFDATLMQTEAVSARSDDTCEQAQTKGSFSRAAKVGDSGANGSGFEYVSCAPGAAVEANYVDTWQLKEEGGRVLLCLNRSSKVVASGFTRVGSQCHQVLADGSLGPFMSLSLITEDGTLSMKTL